MIRAEKSELKLVGYFFNGNDGWGGATGERYKLTA